MEENIVKKTAKELGMTYKELAEAIGVTEGTLRTTATKEEVSKPIEKALGLFKETIELKKEIASTEQLRELLKNFVK